MITLRSYVTESFVPGDGTHAVLLNPATEEPVAVCARASKAQLDQADGRADQPLPQPDHLSGQPCIAGGHHDLRARAGPRERQPLAGPRIPAIRRSCRRSC